MKDVQVLYRDDGFIVRVSDGEHVDEKKFDLEQHAVSWAAGQCARLGLPEPLGQGAAPDITH
jgi:hypothetical protein